METSSNVTFDPISSSITELSSQTMNMMISEDDDDISYQNSILREIFINSHVKLNQQLLNIKEMMINDKNSAISELKSDYEKKIQEKNEIIRELQIKLENQHQESLKTYAEHDFLLESTKNEHNQELKVKELQLNFEKWRQNIEKSRLSNQVDVLVDKIAQQNMTTKAFLTLLQQQHQSKVDKLKLDLTEYMNSNTKEVM